jgi:hypothetical protein
MASPDGDGPVVPGTGGREAQAMSYTLNLDFRQSYVHALVTGRNTRQNVLDYMADIARECAARDVRYVLIEERLEGPRLGTMDVFEIASQQGRPLGSGVRGIAYVDVNASGDLMKFAEDVAVNRGYPVRVFSNVTDAENWLVAKANGARRAARRG